MKELSDEQIMSYALEEQPYECCGSYKYGNPRVILQIAEFGKWLDGYPCINLDREIDTTYSILCYMSSSGARSFPPAMAMVSTS